MVYDIQYCFSHILFIYGCFCLCVLLFVLKGRQRKLNDNFGLQDQVYFHFIYIYICIFSYVKIRVNPVLTRPLKDWVRVIGCATHLGRPFFFTQTHLTRTRLTRPVCQVYLHLKNSRIFVGEIYNNPPRLQIKGLGNLCFSKVIRKTPSC